MTVSVSTTKLPFLGGVGPPTKDGGMRRLSRVIGVTKEPFVIGNIVATGNTEGTGRTNTSTVVMSGRKKEILSRYPTATRILRRVMGRIGNSVGVLISKKVHSNASVFGTLTLNTSNMLVYQPFIMTICNNKRRNIGLCVSGLKTRLGSTVRVYNTRSISRVAESVMECCRS